MRFQNIRLQDFRNVEFAELDLSHIRVFLLGPNGQGKSNLLEALGLVTALRSFRTQSMSALLRRDAQAYTVVYSLLDEKEGIVKLEIQGGSKGRKVFLDGEPVNRLGDYIGRFPVVSLSSGDLVILRGTPGDRRRFLDLTISAVDSDYYEALRLYSRGVSERNRLLKRGGSAAELSAFEARMAPAAVLLVEKRISAVTRLREVLVEIYSAMAEDCEGPELIFKADQESVDADNYRRLWEQCRERDKIIGATQKGPHRDDFELRLEVGGAREFGSDGQQRALCVALRMAQARLFQSAFGQAPVLLADDILGELDPRRRAAFWQVCPEDWQIIATGTAFPEGEQDWGVWQVSAGNFSRH